jgi:hypothetical protein
MRPLDKVLVVTLPNTNLLLPAVILANHEGDALFLYVVSVHYFRYLSKTILALTNIDHFAIMLSCA